MEEEEKNRCLVETEHGSIGGTIIKEFEEIGAQMMVQSLQLYS